MGQEKMQMSTDIKMPAELEMVTARRPSSGMVESQVPAYDF